MSTFILIITIYSSSVGGMGLKSTSESISVTQVGPFATKKHCLNAGNAWLRESKRIGGKRSALCVQSK